MEMNNGVKGKVREGGLKEEVWDADGPISWALPSSLSSPPLPPPPSPPRLQGRARPS